MAERDTSTTHSAIQRLVDAGKVVPGEKVYAGRQIIGHETSIREGVYIGREEREAIVVSEKGEGGEKLLEAYRSLVEKIRVKNYVFSGENIQELLAIICDYVALRIPYNENFVREVVKQVGPDGKISLAAFLDKGGVCRHQALFAGYLLEKLIEEYVLPYEAHIERNDLGKTLGGHAWILAINNNGKEYIVDPTKGVHAEKSQAIAWIYDRAGWESVMKKKQE